MSWRSVGKSSRLVRPFAFTGLGLTMLAILSQPVGAVDTQIGARICGSSPVQATLDITQPTDDSVVNQSPVTFRGNVTSASQIIIEFNGAYSNTIALAANQTTFSTDITMPQGTHTITMRATEVCGGADGVDSVVLTYQPLSQPSTGTTTNTSVGSTNPDAGVVITDQPIQRSDSAEAVSQVPVVGPVLSVVSDFASAIGLESTVTSGSSALAGVARVGVTVTALTTVVMASAWAPTAAQVVPGVSELFDASSHRSMLYLGWIIRGIGALAMAFAYLL